MKPKLVFMAILSIILIIGISGCAKTDNPPNLAKQEDSGQQNAPPAEPTNAGTDTVPVAEAGQDNAAPKGADDAVQAAKEYVVEITDAGYSPNKVTIKPGDTVKWVNKSSSGNWPASAKHPTHTVYPGSDITKCGTAEESKIFDACKGLKAGESYSFTFNEKGTWAYHEHIAVKMFGQVVVE